MKSFTKLLMSASMHFSRPLILYKVPALYVRSCMHLMELKIQNASLMGTSLDLNPSVIEGMNFFFM